MLARAAGALAGLIAPDTLKFLHELLSLPIAMQQISVHVALTH